MLKHNTKCLVCENTMYKRPSQIKRGKVFCKNTCYFKWLSENRHKENNPNWKGDDIVLHNGRLRARRWFGTHRPCEMCGKSGENHHKDGNPLNNNPENIQSLCRKHHMEIDGRSILFVKLMRDANPYFKKSI